MQPLGIRWETAEGGVAEEHFFGVYLRNKLGARFRHRPRHNTGPKLLAACLPGEHHEIGLLLFALAAHERGFRVVLLGGTSVRRRDAIVAAGVTPLGADIAAGVKRLAETLGPAAR